jgi:4-hydroxy-tetrahydrodipicolinate reductase
MKVCIAGATGGVGRELVQAVLDSDDFTLVSAVARKAVGVDVGVALGTQDCGVTVVSDIDEALRSRPDVLIDYTHPDVGMSHAMSAVEHSVPTVIGTTGFTANDFDTLDRAARDAGIGLVTGNMSLTAALLQHFSLQAAEHIPNWTILEYCKASKPDVPSGTARELAELMGEVRAPIYQLGLDEHVGDTTSLGADVAGTRVHAVRTPGIIEAAVEVLFGLPGERLTIRHDAEDSTIFVAGTLLAAQRVSAFTGLVRGLNRLLFNE